MCVCFQDLAECNQIVEVYVKWLTIDDITSSILIIFNYMYAIHCMVNIYLKPIGDR